MCGYMDGCRTGRSSQAFWSALWKARNPAVCPEPSYASLADGDEHFADGAVLDGGVRCRRLVERK